MLQCEGAYSKGPADCATSEVATNVGLTRAHDREELFSAGGANRLSSNPSGLIRLKLKTLQTFCFG